MNTNAGIFDKLVQALPTQTARRARLVAVADDEQLTHFSTAADNHMADGCRLCAPAAGVGGVLNVAAGMDQAALTAQRSPNRKLTVGGMGLLLSG